MLRPTQPTGGGPGASPTQAINLPTVIAAVDIPLGTIITADMVREETLPVGNRDRNAVGVVSQAIGKTTRTALVAGQQVSSDDFQNRAVQLTVPAGRRAWAMTV